MLFSLLNDHFHSNNLTFVFVSLTLQLQSLLQISLAVFDIYCLIEAAPGSKHFRSFGISFMFVYSGNQHGKHTVKLL